MKDQEAADTCLIEMFKRVGLDYDKKTILEYAMQKDWFHLKTWTQEEDDAFNKWMYKFLGKNTNYYAVQRQGMVDMFMLQYGWKIADTCKKVTESEITEREYNRV